MNKELTPKIEGVPAIDYLRSVEDNGRTLIIVGDHPDKRQDMYEAFERALISDIGFSVKDDYMSINASALFEDGLAEFDYNVSLHSDHEVYGSLVEMYVHPSTTVIALRSGCECERVDRTVDAEPVGGTSALFAVIVGLVLGYKRMYLCGVRLEPGSIYYDEHVRDNWALWKPILQPHLTVIGESWLKEMYDES